MQLNRFLKVVGAFPHNWHLISLTGLLIVAGCQPKTKVKTRVVQELPQQTIRLTPASEGLQIRHVSTTTNDTALPDEEKLLRQVRSNSSEGHILLAGEENPFLPNNKRENRLLYLDTSLSALGELLMAWPMLLRETDSFLTQATDGSQFEIYVTGPGAGHPHMVMSLTVHQGLPRVRREAADAALQQLLRLRRELLTHPPDVAGSYLVEDLRTLAVRGGRFIGPTMLLAFTDAEQHSPFLKDSQVLNTPANILIGKLLKQMPKLTRPPERITLVYMTPRIEQGALNGSEGERRTAFFAELFTAWGVASNGVRIEEPTELDTQLDLSSLEGLKAESPEKGTQSSSPKNDLITAKAGR